jgi:CobQ/CobB/MinD/ParA nucleotide binding domain
MIKVVVNTKGGVGKTTISNHLAPLLFNSDEVITVLELDNNNNSAIYEESDAITGMSLGTKDKDLQEAVEEALFSTLAGKNVVIDAGGGDDSVRVISAIVDAGEECHFIVPFAPTFEALENIQQTVSLLPDNSEKTLIFSNYTDLKNDFWFIFGLDEFGIDADFSIFKKFNSFAYAPKTNLVEITKRYKKTLQDIALISSTYDYNEAKKEWFELGKDEFKKKLRMHSLSLACYRYTSEFLKSFSTKKPS